jgi:hypothetical protein
VRQIRIAPSTARAAEAQAAVATSKAADAKKSIGIGIATGVHIIRPIVRTIQTCAEDTHVRPT